MDCTSEIISVVDVYDIASWIGKEFEKLIETHGTETVTGLMPKVICALEHLEVLASRCESEDSEVSQLKNIIKQLQNEKHETAEHRHRFEQDIEQIEDNWKQENKDLNNIVSRLQEENYRLRNGLAEYQNTKDNDSFGHSSVINEEQLKIAQNLKELADKQQERLHTYEIEKIQHKNEFDLLQCQLEKSNKTASEMRKKYKSGQKQLKLLVDEKAELQAQVQEQERELLIIKERLGTAVKENEDLTRNKSSEELPDLQNKLVIDLDDPNRPRFTLQEVKRILNERNELKVKLCEIQDELEYMQQKHPSQSSTPEHKRAESPTPSANSSSYEEDVAPVQGPINKEPDEKLYPDAKRPSFIRKIFQSIFRERNHGEYFPLVSKMPFSISTDRLSNLTK